MPAGPPPTGDAVTSPDPRSPCPKTSPAGPSPSTSATAAEPAPSASKDANHDQPFEGAAGFDDLVELAPGLWWQPPLLSLTRQLVWAAPTRLVRLFTNTRHYAICEMKYLRLDEPGYFAFLPKCQSFLDNWIT
jgi:hypothetical protein